MSPKNTKTINDWATAGFLLLLPQLTAHTVLYVHVQKAHA